MIGTALKRLRVCVSVAMLLMATVLFTSMIGKIALALQWVAKIQIFPLALGGAVAGILLWLGVTLLLGRIYCSSVCPLGVLQDIFAHINRMNRKRRFRHGYHYETPRNKFRYTFLILIVGCAVAGISTALTLFDPYSAFGRIASEILLPVFQWISQYPVMVASWLAFGIALTTLIAIATVSWKHGRLIYNTICPVGSTLSVVSRYSLMHFEIDTDVCVSCGLCGKVCKSQCIDTKAHTVDSSRCVVCFNCVDTCHDNAIRYTFRRKKLSIPMMRPIEAAPAAPTAIEQSGNTSANMAEDAAFAPMKIDRRQFLLTGAILAATPAVLAAEKKYKRIQAIAVKRKPIEGLRPVMPPGHKSIATFLEKCTGCGLCVANCPAKVLRPAAGRLG